MLKWEYLEVAWLDGRWIDSQGHHGEFAKVPPAERTWLAEGEDMRTMAPCLNELGEAGWELATSTASSNDYHTWGAARLQAAEGRGLTW